MTQMQKNELDKAITRAQAYGIVITGHGRRKSDSARIFCTTSRGNNNHWHIVALVGGRLVCDCAASQYGRICVHRAVVHLELVAEAARRRTQDELVTRAMPAEVTSLQKRPAHESALLYRSNAPISIFK